MNNYFQLSAIVRQSVCFDGLTALPQTLTTQPGQNIDTSTLGSTLRSPMACGYYSLQHFRESTGSHST